MKHSHSLRSLGALALLGFAGYTGEVGAQTSGLEIGGDAANFGVHPVAPGFLPDPMNIDVVSGGNLDARTLGLSRGCKGWVTPRPDAIVRLSAGTQLLRFYVTAQGNADTTLVVNHANGSWRCNDDSWNGLNPTVDVRNATPGQYDIWVGSYHQGEQARGTLHVTELVANHP